MHLIGHHETSGNAAHYEEQLGAAFDLDAKYGIDAVKTGYVADAGQAKFKGPDGQVHYGWHDGQAAARHHLLVVTEAAKRHVSIDAHEPIKDTGLRRTYPNWVSREGARGMEYNAWGNPPNPPEHEANLVFTRMLAGPFDFTPGVISLQGRGQKLQSTVAKQLANYVVIYSPIQMAADLPENYLADAKAFQFIKDVPVDWADTRVLNGEVGAFVTIARADRTSDAWYVGSVTDQAARDLSVRLDFLDPGRKYSAQIYRDAPGFDWRTAPLAADKSATVIVETRVVTSADTLQLVLNAGGGAAVRLVPVDGRSRDGGAPPR